MNTAVRALKLILFSVGLSFFVWAIGLQANDPDGWLWAPFYALTAAFGLGLLALRKQSVQTKMSLVYTHLALIGMLAVWVITHTAAAYNPGGNQELLHEAGGIGIALIWNLSLMFAIARRSQETSVELGENRVD
jgi:hypothetical protein